MKKLRINNMKKFIKGILIILGIAILFSIIIPKETLSHKEVNYKTIYVSEGDTLWNIALEEQNSNIYYEGKDVRQIVNNIKDINNLSSSNLKIGQKLLIAE